VAVWRQLAGPGGQPDPVVGSRLFTDGSTRTVHTDAGRQYVLDDEGGRVYGTWLVPESEPDTAIIVVDPDKRGNAWDAGSTPSTVPWSWS
jgi:hypothetical protein